MHTIDINNPVKIINPPDNWAKLENTKKKIIAGSTNRRISFMSMLIVRSVDFIDSGNKGPNRNAKTMTKISFAGKLKKKFLKFVKLTSLN